MPEFLAMMPHPPGGLLTWSLALAFGSIFLAVLGAAIALRPARVYRRLGRVRGQTGKTANVQGPLAAVNPAARRRRHKTSYSPFAVLVTLSLVMGLAWLSSAGALTWVQGAALGGASIVVTWLLPGRLRAWRVLQRQQALRRGFPDALDMMVVCVEAGLGLDAALNRVAAEIAEAHPPVAAELAQVGRELRAGRDRGTVLRSFAHRTGLPEIASFATLLIQSEALGTGIARSLRVQAEEMRADRMQRAEVLAHTLPVKLTIPLVFCVMPAMIAAVLLPSAINIVRDILPNLGH